MTCAARARTAGEPAQTLDAPRRVGRVDRELSRGYSRRQRSCSKARNVQRSEGPADKPPPLERGHPGRPRPILWLPPPEPRDRRGLVPRKSCKRAVPARALEIL